MTTAKKSSNSDGPTFRSGETSKPSTAMPSSENMDEQTLFPVAFLAKTSRSPAEVSASVANARGFGKKCSESFAKYDPDTSLWRTSQLCFQGGLESFSETWPRSGMTRSGIAYRLPPSAPLTGEIEFGLLPTPDCSDRRSMKSKQQGGKVDKILHTPPQRELADPNNGGCLHGQAQIDPAEGRFDALGQPLPSCEEVADTYRQRLEGERPIGRKERRENPKRQTRLFDGTIHRSKWWAVEPNVGRVAHGVASRVDRLKCLGNGQVVFVVKYIAERILDFEKMQSL